jgi:hypothetical protein
MPRPHRVRTGEKNAISRAGTAKSLSTILAVPTSGRASGNKITAEGDQIVSRVCINVIRLN